MKIELADVVKVWLSLPSFFSFPLFLFFSSFPLFPLTLGYGTFAGGAGIDDNRDNVVKNFIISLFPPPLPSSLFFFFPPSALLYEHVRHELRHDEESRRSNRRRLGIFSPPPFPFFFFPFSFSLFFLFPSACKAVVTKPDAPLGMRI